MPSENYSGRTCAAAAITTTTLLLLTLNIKCIGSARERYNVTGFLKCATQSNSDRSLLFGIYRTSCRKTSSIFADAVARVCASVRGFEEVDKITVPHNERVTVRCRELGKYKFVGDASLHCGNGTWDGKVPHCEATTSISNYTGTS
ncbi:uncharacterized protein LOC109862775 [Pseudomyrmex gracilis]|uniref:uncharacterized protein LOC109862775 n=1 Tax=Pseudomyrmex gracilis TaxID=219809 RepID=UPI0009952506|nr:uncharacterized protein LOC109862775 [Pseudomyrmex gracilis]